MNRESMVIIEKLCWSVNEHSNHLRSSEPNQVPIKNVCKYTLYVVEVLFKAIASNPLDRIC